MNYSSIFVSNKTEAVKKKNQKKTFRCRPKRDFLIISGKKMSKTTLRRQGCLKRWPDEDHTTPKPRASQKQRSPGEWEASNLSNK